MTEYERLIRDARRFLEAGKPHDFQVPPHALDLAVELGISPAWFRTHFLVMAYERWLADQPTAFSLPTAHDPPGEST
ncbi:hypothetical protein ACQP25_01750 [Microtetraspora malaysiensis]|uniref:hypothetical protein n=1 Tax=Microtetraspora malaysiensis TaxID=161358 RepID=UPI003D90114E